MSGDTTVKYTVGDKSWQQVIPEQLIPSPMFREQMVAASKGYLQFILGKGGDFEVTESAEEKNDNTPCHARLVNQFEKDRDTGMFAGTGKVLLWCNCGATTGWVDLHDRYKVIPDFFKQHDPGRELGIRLDGFHLGELHGYRVELRYTTPIDAEVYLRHQNCGWEEEIPWDSELSDIVYKAVQASSHICAEQRPEVS